MLSALFWRGASTAMLSFYSLRAEWSEPEGRERAWPAVCLLAGATFVAGVAAGMVTRVLGI